MLADLKEGLIEVLMDSVQIGREHGTLTDEQYIEALNTATDIRNMDEETFYLLLDKTFESVWTEKIERGAKFIAEIGKDHPRYEEAMQKFERLCSELEDMRERNKRYRKFCEEMREKHAQKQNAYSR